MHLEGAADGTGLSGEEPSGGVDAFRGGVGRVPFSRCRHRLPVVGESISIETTNILSHLDSVSRTADDGRVDTREVSMSRRITIKTLRSAPDCPDGRTCPSIHSVAERPDRRYVVTKRVTDPAEITAFATWVGDDEQLGWVPVDLLPGV